MSRPKAKKLMRLPANAGVLHDEWQPEIRWCARKHVPFAGNGLTAEDLAQAASEAFFLALPKWDQNHPGHKAWMRRVIKTAITDVMRSQQNAVRFPRDVWALRADAANAEGVLTHQYGREPTLFELAEVLGVDAEVIKEMRCKTTAPQSLDETRPDSGDLALELADAGSWEMADRIAVRLERQQHVARMLDDLSEPTARVVRLKWGLDANGYELDNKDIAKRLGKSSEWVRLRLREAERHIRHVGLDRTRRRDIKLIPKDIEALLPTKDLAWYDLTGAGLSWADLNGANLTGASLRNADLTGADLGGADLTGADLGGANLRQAYLDWADLGEAYLGGADLSKADLSSGYFDRAYLGEANLGGADLRKAKLRGADLSKAKLRGADLAGADLAGANLFLAELRGTNLFMADLREADLTGADLREADLSRADLRGADLSRADLSGADLSEVDLSGAAGIAA